MGKTTLAAAAALDLARREDVLLVSTDPAHSLADVLRQPLGARARRVHGVAAVELDAAGALRRWLRPRRALLRLIGERGTYLEAGDIDALLEAALPGLGELIALQDLRRLAEAGGYRHVVVDSAPTGHTLRLLDMPDTLAQLARVLDDMQARHRALVSALSGGYRQDAADSFIAELEREAAETAALLRDGERTAFSWVLDAEDLALEEARDGLAALRLRGILVDEVIVNRLTPAPTGRCPLCEGRRSSQARVLRRARRELGPAVRRVVAAREQEPRGPAALKALGRALHASPRPAPAAGGRVRRLRPPARPAPWAALLAPRGRRILMLAGKGGVGKTSAAAAAALELAAGGREVLLLSTDPAHSLGDALGAALGDDVRRVAGAPRLRAREIDALAAYAARRERYRALMDELFSGRGGRSGVEAAYDRAVARDLLDTAPPGIDELFALDALTAAVDPDAPPADRADVVVVDTAPTGHALRLLALPDAVLDWLHTFLRILRRDRLAARVPTLTEELLSLARNVRHLLELLRDPQRAAVAVVTRAAEVPAAETARLLSGLRGLSVPVAALIVNGLTPPPPVGACGRCRRAVRREAALLADLARGGAGRRPPRLRLRAPLLAEPPRGLAALRAWAAQWRILDA